MSFEPQFKKLSIEREKECFNSQVKLECKTEVYGDSIERVLSIVDNVYIDADSENTKKYVGKAVFYVCYLDKEGVLKKSECGGEFSGEVDIDCEGDISYSGKNEKISADIVNNRLVITSYIRVIARCNTREEVESLIGGENIIAQEKEVEIIKKYGKKCGNYPINEEFTLKYCIKEVLCHKAESVITAVQCGVGSVIVDGEVYISSIVLQNEEKGDTILKENRIIPFRMEIEYEDAMPNFNANADVFVKGIRSDISVDDEGKESTVNVTITLGYEVEAFSCEKENIAQDAFSLTNNVGIAKEKVEGFKPCGVVEEKVRATIKAPIEKIEIGERVVAIYNEKAHVVDYKNVDGYLEINGYYSCDIFVLGVDNKYSLRKIESPFSVKLSSKYSSKENDAITIVCSDGNAKIVSSEEIEIESQFAVAISTREKFEFNYINSIVDNGEKQGDLHPISVYIPHCGEELWELSKRLNVCPNTLVESNKDLQFPLTGKERIVVFRKK